MTKEILNKYLNGNCSGEELKEVIKWIRDESSNPGQMDLVKELWDDNIPEHNLPDEKKFDSLLDRIHHKMNIKQQRKPGLKAIKRPVITWITRAAAIFLIPLLVYHYYSS